MNSEPQIFSLPPDPPDALPSDVPASPPPAFTHRGVGKIARLPKATRQQVNEWILDGVPYSDIIQRLGDLGKGLNPGHLSEYKKRGYVDWLRQREWFENVTANSEFSKGLLDAPDTTALHEAGLRIAASQMLGQLMRLGVGEDAADAPLDPEQFARLVNALSRLTREALAFQKYHHSSAQARSVLHELKDPERELNQSETRAIVRKIDSIFGLGPPLNE
jgi:hypothetical protein